MSDIAKYCTKNYCISRLRRGWARSNCPECVSVPGRQPARGTHPAGGQIAPPLRSPCFPWLGARGTSSWLAPKTWWSLRARRESSHWCVVAQGWGDGTGIQFDRARALLVIDGGVDPAPSPAMPATRVQALILDNPRWCGYRPGVNFNNQQTVAKVTARGAGWCMSARINCFCTGHPGIEQYHPEESVGTTCTPAGVQLAGQKSAQSHAAVNEDKLHSSFVLS
jgi:hypothetical protein